MQSATEEHFASRKQCSGESRPEYYKPPDTGGTPDRQSNRARSMPTHEGSRHPKSKSKRWVIVDSDKGRRSCCLEGFLRRGDLVQDPPAPLLSPGGGGELYPVAPPVLAVDVEEEEIPLLQLVYQTQGNVEESWRTGDIEPRDKIQVSC